MCLRLLIPMAVNPVLDSACVTHLVDPETAPQAARSQLAVTMSFPSIGGLGMLVKGIIDSSYEKENRRPAMTCLRPRPTIGLIEPVSIVGGLASEATETRGQLLTREEFPRQSIYPTLDTASSSESERWYHVS
jgi:hypothetical protein